MKRKQVIREPEMEAAVEQHNDFQDSFFEQMQENADQEAARIARRPVRRMRQVQFEREF